MAVPSKSPWAWRRILNCRSKALTFIKYIPGLSSDFLLWHDPWLNNKPLKQHNDDSLLSALESHSFALLNSIQRDNTWFLGVSNYLPVRDLRAHCENILIRGMDRIIWDSGGTSIVSASSIYGSMVDHRNAPPWLPFVWSRFRIAKHAFTAWIIMKERLLTKDRMQSFHLNVNQLCLLCGNCNENHQHLFSTCNFSRTIFNACPLTVSVSWSDMCAGRFFTISSDGIRTNIAYLFLAAAFYNIWFERNLRLHHPGKFNQPNIIIRRIQEDIRGCLHNSEAFNRAARLDVTLHSFIY
nr:PREDICTED: uncharacterized protein LOC108204113 [Daucus carota subsp. sativus]